MKINKMDGLGDFSHMNDQGEFVFKAKGKTLKEELSSLYIEAYEKEKELFLKSFTPDKEVIESLKRSARSGSNHHTFDFLDCEHVRYLEYQGMTVTKHKSRTKHPSNPYVGKIVIQYVVKFINQ